MVGIYFLSSKNAEVAIKTGTGKCHPFLGFMTILDHTNYTLQAALSLRYYSCKDHHLSYVQHDRYAKLKERQDKTDGSVKIGSKKYAIDPRSQSAEDAHSYLDV